MLNANNDCNCVGLGWACAWEPAFKPKVVPLECRERSNGARTYIELEVRELSNKQGLCLVHEREESLLDQSNWVHGSFSA